MEFKTEWMTLDGGGKVVSVAELNCGYTHICVDDNCWIVVNGKEGRAVFSEWIFGEAMEVLKQLPNRPSDYQPFMDFLISGEYEYIPFKSMMTPAGVINANHDMYTKEALKEAANNFIKRKEAGLDAPVFFRYKDADDISKLIGKVENLYTDGDGNLWAEGVINSMIDLDKIKMLEKYKDDWTVRAAVTISPEDVIEREDGVCEVKKCEVTHAAIVWKHEDAYSIGGHIVEEKTAEN